MTDNLAAEIAEHRECPLDGRCGETTMPHCMRCREAWPCLMRRLADRQRNFEAKMEKRSRWLEAARADRDVALEALKAIRLLLDAAEAASSGPAKGGTFAQVTTTDRLEV